MQFDSNLLKMLLACSDDELWKTITKIAQANGIALHESPPSREEMARLRSLLSGASNTDYKDALNLLAAYKR